MEEAVRTSVLSFRIYVQHDTLGQRDNLGSRVFYVTPWGKNTDAVWWSPPHSLTPTVRMNGESLAILLELPLRFPIKPPGNIQPFDGSTYVQIEQWDIPRIVAVVVFSAIGSVG